MAPPSGLTLLTTLITAACAAQLGGTTYTLSSSLTGQDFLDAFQWNAIADPTDGRVNYVDQPTAEAGGLYSIDGNAVTLRADYTSYLSASGPGRNSFRLLSYNQYTTHVAIFDIAHMPQGCGTWPAVYYQELGANWPNEGEIDILEGVNDVSPNQATFHANAGCTMPANRQMTGRSLGSNCDVNETNNESCGVSFTDMNSYGPKFNDLGGGWYAIERTSTYVSIYFWERGSSSVPRQVSNPGNTIDTSTWGEPVANYPNTDCDFTTHLGPHNILINLTFCGVWAGNDTVYPVSGCPSTCVDYVDNNPYAFTDAYFTFNGLYIYE